MASDIPVEWVSLDEMDEIERALQAAEAVRASVATPGSATTTPGKAALRSEGSHTCSPSEAAFGAFSPRGSAPVNSRPPAAAEQGTGLRTVRSTPVTATARLDDNPRPEQVEPAVPWQQNLPLKSLTPPRVAGPLYPPPASSPPVSTAVESSKGLETAVQRQSAAVLQSSGPTLQQQLMKNTLATTVDYCLVSKERFAAKCSRRNDLLTSAMSEVPDMEYDDKRGRWSFPVSQYYALTRTLTGTPRVNVQQLPVRVRAVFVDGKRRSAPASLDKLPPILLNKLLPFQREGILFALEKSGRALFGDEMGLGKTIQAVSVALHYKAEWPLLIICPSSLRYNWSGELQKWAPSLSESDIRIVLNGKSKADGLVNIISYDMATRLIKHLHEKRFAVVICDESHYLKNYQAQRTKKIIPLLKSARRALLLTGTPAVSRPDEIYTQVDALLPKAFGSFRQFAIRYCDGHDGKFGFVHTGASNLEELHLLLAEEVMVRRLKDDVLSQLPPKIRQRVWVEVTAKHKKAMKAIFTKLREAKKNLRSTNSEKVYESKQMTFQLIGDLFNCSGKAKIPCVLEYMKELLESNVKFIIFGHHQDVVEAVCYKLEQLKVDFIRIDGKTAPKHRQGLVDYYQGNEKCRVAVLSILAAGCGLTLTKASAVVFAELYWNPGMLLQAEDRAHRIGQKNSINVYYLVAKDTIDDLIWQKLERKLTVLGNTLNGAASTLGLDQDDAENEETYTSMDKSIFGELLDDNDAFINQIVGSVDTESVEQRHEQRLARRAEIKAVRMGAPRPEPEPEPERKQMTVAAVASITSPHVPATVSLSAAVATHRETPEAAVRKRQLPASTNKVGGARLAALQYKPRSRSSHGSAATAAKPVSFSALVSAVVTPSDTLEQPDGPRKSPLAAADDAAEQDHLSPSPSPSPEGTAKLMARKYQPRKRRKAFVE